MVYKPFGLPGIARDADRNAIELSYDQLGRKVGEDDPNAGATRLFYNGFGEVRRSGSRISGADASFYLHEVSEATMMGRGLSYYAAHADALGKYGVSPFSVYHPEVVAANPGVFNSNWFNFWGIQ